MCRDLASHIHVLCDARSLDPAPVRMALALAREGSNSKPTRYPFAFAELA